MKKIKKNISDYIVMGSLGIVALGGITYCAYNTIHNKTITKEGSSAAYVAVGATALGICYRGSKLIEESLKETTKLKEDIQKNNLEKEIQE